MFLIMMCDKCFECLIRNKNITPFVEIYIDDDEGVEEDGNIVIFFPPANNIIW